ncbi:methyl-accepting chemotaxis protein [Marinomonas sp. MED121]|uniref:methyl-accepting chemotaxis protein n=1 Tax=Marinomonas sp. MED121 TaxID=314277 RepID=UPI0002D39290|nr:methyl-accepting chemotaxis protein [Marinomonas sp. MED121]
MMSFHLSLKHKLYIVITLALLGFSLLILLSSNVLNTLEVASKRVDDIRNDANLLKDLQIEVLQINQNTNEERLRALPETYKDQLDQIVQKTEIKQAEIVSDIQLSLRAFTESRLLWIAEDKKVGASAEEGLRAQMQASFSALEGDLFANFRKPFAELAQSYIAFMDQRNEAENQKVKLALANFKSLTYEMEFEELYGDKISEIESLLAELSTGIFSMNEQAKKAQKAYQALAKGVLLSNAYFAEQLTLAKQNATLVSDQAQTQIVSIALAVALLVVGLLIAISRSLVGSLGRMSGVMYQLAEGDLTQKLAVNQGRNDELDKVGVAVNDMTTSLNNVLNRVNQSSQTLDKGAHDLSHKLNLMLDKSTATNEQAGSVAVATEQISTTIQNMVSATDEALQKTNLAQSSAEQGGEVITNAIGSLGQLAEVFDHLNQQVEELEGTSRKVDGVTEMINGLAEQTNLLALNAAIEAARAGEQGRGFSVVADEVRSLAEKTVHATQNINDIIGAMHTSIQSLLKVMEAGSGHVENGKQLGDEAATAVGQIKHLVVDVNQSNQALATSIEEASKATQVIAQSMDQVANNVSENKAQSQEVLDYVEQVSDRAKDLLVMVGKFKI